MKQTYRRRVLDDLLMQLDSGDYDVREYGLFQLALILDRSKLAIDAAALPDYYAENLSRDLLRLRLSRIEQSEIGARLARHASSQKQSRSSSIWTLAKLDADIGFPLLLGLVQSLGKRIDDKSAIQVCEALRNWIALKDQGLDSLLDTDVMHFVVRVLRQWRERDNSNLKNASTVVIGLLAAKCDESAGGADQ